MTSTPQEPVNSAEDDPTDEPVAGLLHDEDDLPPHQDDQIEVGLGPTG